MITSRVNLANYVSGYCINPVSERVCGGVGGGSFP